MSSISRRSVAKGAAWTVPAVLASSAIPAYAASRTQISGGVCQLYYADGSSVSYQVHAISLSVKSSTGIIPAGTVVTWSFTMSGGTAMEVPTPEYGKSSNWSFVVSPSPGTAATSFTATFTANADMDAANFACAPRLVWNNDTTVSGGTTITVTSNISGAVPVPSSLSYVVAKRSPTSVNSSGRTPHKYLSKSGGQACYPDIQYVLTGASRHSVCGVNGSDTSTVYPDGTCDKINTTSTSGQQILSGRC